MEKAQEKAVLEAARASLEAKGLLAELLKAQAELAASLMLEGAASSGVPVPAGFGVNEKVEARRPREKRNKLRTPQRQRLRWRRLLRRSLLRKRRQSRRTTVMHRQSRRRHVRRGVSCRCSGCV